MPFEKPLAVIDAADRYGDRTLLEIWEYRDLLALFTWREIQLRYRQTAAGIAWALLQPLLIMVTLSMFASGMGVKTGRIPYPLFTISGLVPWMYFTHAFTKTTFSLVAQSGVMSEIYFPRLIVPVAAAAGGAMDFFVAALLLPVFMLYYGTPPTFALLALPLFVAMALATAFSMGLLLAVLNVKYKDVGNALPFFTQLMFFATPIAYPASALPHSLRMISACNPMTGVVEGFRWAILGGRMDWQMAIPGMTVAALLVASVWFFRWQESSFIDHL